MIVYAQLVIICLYVAMLATGIWLVRLVRELIANHPQGRHHPDGHRVEAATDRPRPTRGTLPGASAVRCDRCDGRGTDPLDDECPTCEGTGRDWPRLWEVIAVWILATAVIGVAILTAVEVAW